MLVIDPTRIRKSVSNISRLKESNKEHICKIVKMSGPRETCYPFVQITYDLLRWICLLNVKGAPCSEMISPSIHDVSTTAVEEVVA
jgi:hypothetical protein